MTQPEAAEFPILVASESAATAALVKKLLDEEFDAVQVSTHPDAAAADFDLKKPGVLLLAFDALEKAERHNLGLFRRSREIHRHPHRTVVLCHKDELKRAYELCRGGIFDNYVLFWPVAQDATRLPMAVHQALRDLEAARSGRPQLADLSGPVRRLGDLETSLSRGMQEGDDRIEATDRVVRQAGQEILGALAGFSASLAQGELAGLVQTRDGPALAQAFKTLQEEALAPPLGSAMESVRPLKQWAEGFRQASEPHLDALRSLRGLTETLRPTLMAVDDDPFQHRLLASLLEGQGYDLVSVHSGIEALNRLHRLLPDLVLLDLAMPDMDGLEVARRMKGLASFAHVPIIMITGHSEEGMVTQCLEAGAVDFMVKPFGRTALLAKLAKLLGPSTPA